MVLLIIKTSQMKGWWCNKTFKGLIWHATLIKDRLFFLLMSSHRFQTARQTSSFLVEEALPPKESEMFGTWLFCRHGYCCIEILGPRFDTSPIDLKPNPASWTTCYSLSTLQLTQPHFSTVLLPPPTPLFSSPFTPPTPIASFFFLSHVESIISCLVERASKHPRPRRRASRVGVGGGRGGCTVVTLP